MMSMAVTEINLTVIGDRACSTTRTYLTYLRAAGLRPRRLWLVDFVRPTPTLLRLRALIGERLAELWRRSRAPHAQATDADYRALCLQLQREAGFDPIDHFGHWQSQELASKVEQFSASDFHDPVLQRRLLNMTDTAFLYTNGGIVPASLLDKPGVRVLHIHPGIVPDIRGSDCLLWSAQVRRRIGVSCFYMSPGIDEGPLIGQHETDLPHLPTMAELLPAGREPELYRALLFAVDPHFRARLLVEVLQQHPGTDLRSLPFVTQPPARRPAYLWMHPRLRTRVMKDAFL
ncbi:MAG: Formyl transferase [Candidatus Accumulibacter regalis]|jgi:hypothetical protein|uniref:Formyl transferase n=2 Tax=Candidatus Accumulibacter TaxID=327159 RepID=A0A011NXE9_ACCRE|nr:formyltransferase family protein [Accumulibacter sp.]EXI87383.1 MAG: Formyl transferase [Candidatus Accumulibacter regalis]MBL8368307.1 hypothetical protein [Accumulibacter sp.]